MADTPSPRRSQTEQLTAPDSLPTPRSPPWRSEKLLPGDTAFRIEAVAQSYAALDTQREEIWRAAPELDAQGIRITGVGIDTIGNRLRVTIESATTAARNTITSHFGTDIAIREGPAAAADACPLNGCMPLKAGIATTDNYDNWPCTIGYLAKRHDGPAGQLVAVTAGHVGLIDIDSGELSQMTNDNHMHRGAGNVYPVVGKLDGANQMMGKLVYRYGRTSGTDNGLINGLYASRQSCVGPPLNQCMEVTKTIRVDFEARGGDSGGPVWYYVFLPGGTTAVIAMGTHVHSDDDDDETPYGWYSPIDVGAAQYLANWAYSYTLCVTASC